MIPDLYEYLTSFKYAGGDMIQRLRDAGVEEIFDPLKKDEDKLFADGDRFNSVLFYILDCYSRNSKKHIGGAEWVVVKKSVSKEVKLPVELHEAVMNIKNAAVQKTIVQWLEYQNARVFTELCMLKDLRQQLMQSALQDLPNGKSGINWDQKAKNAKKASELTGEIDRLEKKMITNKTSTLQSIAELEKETGVHTGMGLSPETNPEVS